MTKKWEMVKKNEFEEKAGGKRKNGGCQRRSKERMEGRGETDYET